MTVRHDINSVLNNLLSIIIWLNTFLSILIKRQLDYTPKCSESVYLKLCVVLYKVKGLVDTEFLKLI